MEDDVGRIRYRRDKPDAGQDTPAKGSNRARGGDRFVGAYDKRFFSSQSVRFLVARLDSLLEQGKVLKSDGASRVCRVECNGRDLVVKRFNHRGLIHSLRHSLKGSRARRGWRNGRQLLDLGIPTPRPLAYVEQRRGRVVWQSYLISENVQGRSLRQVLRDGSLSPDQRATVWRQVNDMLQRLRRHRILHGDLKDTNVLITLAGAVLTDLDDLRIGLAGPLFAMVKYKDLKRLHASMEAYLSTDETAGRQQRTDATATARPVEHA